MSRSILGAMFATVFMLGFSGANAGTADQIASGREDYFTYCAACHGVGAKGDGSVAEFLTIATVDLTQLQKRSAGRFPRERVTLVIDGRIQVKVHGERDMPVWGDWFTEEAATAGVPMTAHEKTVRIRINTLADYLESIQEK